MITAPAALNLVRDQLRTEVLPYLDQTADYPRSVLIAAIGVLGELALRIRDDESWCADSTQRMAAAAQAWPEQLKFAPDHAATVAGLVQSARTADPSRRNREHLLEAAEITLAALWSAPEDADTRGLRNELRELLAEDVDRESRSAKRQE